jgi:O-succinylbenzoic acid--CoA ligase
LLERAREARVPVAPTYGMTETCSQLVTFGFPLHGARVAIDRGEVIVRGPMVAPGAVSADGWLHTGDLARFEEDRLVIIGRNSDTIVTGGENVAPAEIEAVLCTHPDVVDAAVFGRPDPEWGEAVIARVIPRGTQVLDPDRLRAYCRARLAPFKVPRLIELASELPRTESGKLRRRELT